METNVDRDPPAVPRVCSKKRRKGSLIRIRVRLAMNWRALTSGAQRSIVESSHDGARDTPLSLIEAIGIAERLHTGSRAAAISFDTSDNPSYRVRTVKDKEIWENVVDVRTGLIAGPETSWTLNELEMEERDNINALRSVRQELSDAIAIAEKAAAGKTISGGLVKEGDQLNFVVVVLSDDHVKEVFLEPPRATSKNRPAASRR